MLRGLERDHLIGTVLIFAFSAGLVAAWENEIIGYAYAGSFHSRAAYRHSAEVSIYLKEKWHGHGAGRLLYEELERRLIRQNVFVLYACITVAERKNDENLTDASIRFHEKMGYTLVGKHNLCGYKFNKWYSVIWMKKLIADRIDNPDVFVSFSKLNKQINCKGEFSMRKYEKHDGLSPIVFTKGKNAIEKKAQFQQLWNYLVPASGKAQTAQGEVIRIAGRVSHEIMDNGSINWDEDFNKMMKVFVKYMLLGNPLENNAKAAKRISDILLKCAKAGTCNEYMCAGLCECAVDWVQQNPNIMPFLESDYSR